MVPRVGDHLLVDRPCDETSRPVSSAMFTMYKMNSSPAGAFRDPNREWRKSGNEAIFKMEAATKHGFNLQPHAAGNTDPKGARSVVAKEALSGRSGAREFEAASRGGFQLLCLHSAVVLHP